MRASELIRELEPLAGHYVLVHRVRPEVAFVATGAVECVEHLPPRRRREDSGNVILRNPWPLSVTGCPHGFTLWARNTERVEWAPVGLCVTIYKKGGRIYEIRSLYQLR